MTDYLIRGADVLGRGVADIGVHHGRIVDPELLAAGETEVVDAAGLVALPGLVDMHTHLREPGKEDAETVLTGSRAAAAGGYTDRKSTRLNSSHVASSYAVFCLKTQK